MDASKPRKLAFRFDGSTILMKLQISLELHKTSRKAVLEDLQGRVGRALGIRGEASGEASGGSNAGPNQEGPPKATPSQKRPTQGRAKATMASQESHRRGAKSEISSENYLFNIALN